MSGCRSVCRLCDNLIISQAVTFAGGTLTINIPSGSYANGCRYCIVVAQTIPAETTITAPVVVTIGTGTEEYPLVGHDCSPVLAAGMRTRTRYAARVVTNGTGGTFRLLGKPCCTPNNALVAIDGTAPAAAGGGAG